MEQTTPEITENIVETARKIATHTPKGIFIVQEGEDGPVFKIETPESYTRRKSISPTRTSSLKKLSRIQRVRDRGYVKRPATNEDIRRHGPAIVMGETEDA